MFKASALTLAAVFAVGCAAPPEPVSLVVAGTTVIDPSSGQVLAGHSVYIEDGRIVGIDADDARARYVASDTLDGRGRFLIPGLIDAHVHIPRGQEDTGHTLDLLFANGITGVRDMASDCWVPAGSDEQCVELLRTVGQEIDAGERAGPRLLAFASAPVLGPLQRGTPSEGAEPFFTPGTEAEGRQLAGYLDGRPVDLAKVYNTVPRAAYFALVDEATRLGLEISGHLPLGVSVLEASNAGQRTIEHARDLPVACSGYSAEYRTTMAAVVEGQEGVSAPSNQVRIQSVLESFDEAACEQVLNTLVANGTYLVPTHGTREMDFRAGEQEYRDHPAMKFMPAAALEGWTRDLDRTAEATPELVALFGEFYQLGLHLTGLAHAAGVSILAGTDANDTMIIPGFSLHEELERFAEVGIPPMDILKSATTVPAEYLGLSADLGGVTEGRRADLVLLNANPLSDIANTQSIETVILGGRVFDRTDLDERLREAEARAARSASGG